MYDKVNLYYPRLTGTPDISPYLDRAKEQTDRETGQVSIYGGLEGLKVGIYAGGYSIIGSLAKYLYPNNLYPLNRQSTATAIEKLSDAVHLDMREARVTGLEFGTHFPMRHPVGVYLSKLLEMPRLERCQYNAGTLYYRHRGKQQPKDFIFYDKGADAAAKGLSVPDGLTGANLLRYEMRIKNRLAQQLGLSNVFAYNLSERGFYRMLVEKWQGHYYSIQKKTKIKTDVMSDIKTVSDAFDVLVATLINQTDRGQITAFVDTLREQRVFEDRKNYTRLKRKIAEVAGKASVTVSDEDIRELDNEINNAGAFV